jgi:hypothetical protein
MLHARALSIPGHTKLRQVAPEFADFSDILRSIIFTRLEAAFSLTSATHVLRKSCESFYGPSLTDSSTGAQEFAAMHTATDLETLVKAFRQASTSQAEHRCH